MYLLIASILLDLQLGSVHSCLCKIFVVLVFLWKQLSLSIIATLLPVITLLSLENRETPCASWTVSLCGLVLVALTAESPAGFRNGPHVCESVIGVEGNESRL